jgi:hypothetical protein
MLPYEFEQHESDSQARGHYAFAGDGGNLKPQ